MSENTNNFSAVGVAEESPSATPVAHNNSKSLPRLWWGIVIGVLCGGVLFALTVSSNVLVAIVLAILGCTFGASLTLEDSAVRCVLGFMASRSLAFPGLIWEFSIDGFLWLIGMKLLFAAIGFIFGALCAILGFVVALLISPISYPINLISYINDPT